MIWGAWVKFLHDLEHRAGKGALGMAFWCWAHELVLLFSLPWRTQRYPDMNRALQSESRQSGVSPIFVAKQGSQICGAFIKQAMTRRQVGPTGSFE